MNRLILLLSCIILSHTASAQQPDTLWTQILTSPSSDEARHMIRTRDGGYVIVGRTDSSENQTYDAYFIKLNRYGNLSFRRHFDYGGHEELYNIVQLDTGYFMAGAYWGNDGETFATHLARTGVIGYPIWQDTILGRRYGTEGRSIIKLNDGFLIAGAFDGLPSLLKINTYRNVVFNHAYGNLRGRIWQIKPTPDNGYIMVGWTAWADTGQGSVLILIKLDQNCEHVWTREIRGSSPENIEGRAVVVTPDSGYIAVGTREGDATIIKHDVDGAFVWSATVPGISMAHSIIPAIDSGYIIIGYSPGDGIASLIKINDTGNIIWRKNINFTPNDVALRSLVQSPDGNILVVGNFYYTGAVSDILLIMYGYEESGIGDSPIQKPAIVSLTQNYPNPFNPSTTIEFTLPRQEHATLSVFDILGRKVMDIYDQEMNAGYHRNTVTMDVPSGIYLYRLEAGNTVITRKMTLLK